MATRKVLQEIPILIPQVEQQSFQIIEEETPDSSNKLISSPVKLHTKYISNDESKENISPAEFENITKEEKSAVTMTEESNVSNVCVPLSDISDPCTSDYWDNCSETCDSGAGTFLTPGRNIDSQQEVCTTPMDFSKVTVEELGISSESLLKYVGKSPQSLRKYRRRSNIGVRGSPEMNFLIKQIALRKCSAKPEPEPPANPFTSPRNSFLRDKISAFRNVFQAVDENEGKAPFSGFPEEEEFLCDNGTIMGQAVEPPVKRKRECDATTPVVSSVPLFPSHALENTPETLPTPVPRNIAGDDCSLDSGLVSEVFKVPADVKTVEEEAPTKLRSARKRKVMFADLPSQPDQDLSQKSDNHTSSPVLRPVLKKTPRRDYVHFRFGFMEENRVFSVQESLDNEENSQQTDSMKQKKKVTFGRELSPEVFDKTLPPNTPLRRGSTPYNYNKSVNGTPAASVGVSQSPYQPLLQPDFDDQDEEETLQPMSLCFGTDTLSSDSAGASSPLSLPEHSDETMPGVEEENDNHEISFCVENEPSSNESEEEISATISAADIAIAYETSVDSELEMVPAGGRMTCFPNKKKSCSSEETPSILSTQVTDSSETPVTTKAKTSSKKNKKPVITKKSQIKGSRVKGKKGRGKSKKSVQKPVYEVRETVSKKPLLSPIPELPECFPTPPASTPDKTLVKKLSKTRGARKIQVKTIRKVLEDTPDPALSKIEGDADGHQASDVQEGSGQQHLIGKETESLTRNQRPAAPAVLDVDPQTVLSSRCPLSAVGSEMKDEPCQLAPEACELVPMSEEKSTKKTRRQSAKTYFTTRKRVSINASSKGQSDTAEMSSGCVKPEHSLENCPLSPKTSTDAPQQETIANILSDRSNEQSLEAIACATELPFTSITVNDQKTRSSINRRRSNNFSAITEQSTPGETPPLADHSAAGMTDMGFSIDDIFQSTQREKKVRRSMRLRRDSGVGLSWVEESKSTIETGRRKSLRSGDKHVENPRPLLENSSRSPNKENLSDQPAYSATRKARRITLGTSTLQESVPIFEAKRRRSNVHLAGAMTSQKVIMPDA